MARSKNNFSGFGEFVWYQGVVEDRNDPLQIGRVRVRCIGWQTFDRSIIPTEELLWAHPLAPLGPNGQVTPPKEGDWVWGFFRDGQYGQMPVYVGLIPYVQTGQTNIEMLIGDKDDRAFTVIPNDPAADSRNVSGGSSTSSGGTNSSGGSNSTGSGSGGSGQTDGSSNGHNGGTRAPSGGPLFTFDGSQATQCRSDAEEIMQNDTLPRHKRLEAAMGRSITINDAIAKSSTSRVNETPGSQHFFGRALDLSIRGFSDADKLKLAKSAKEVGFTGFGFGGTILHVDTGTPRHWTYNGMTYWAGKRISALGSWVRGTGPWVGDS